MLLGDINPTTLVDGSVAVAVDGIEIRSIGQGAAVGTPVPIVAVQPLVFKDEALPAAIDPDGGLRELFRIFDKPAVVDAVPVGGKALGHVQQGVACFFGQGKGRIAPQVDRMGGMDGAVQQVAAAAVIEMGGVYFGLDHPPLAAVKAGNGQVFQSVVQQGFQFAKHTPTQTDLRLGRALVNRPVETITDGFQRVLVRAFGGSNKGKGQIHRPGIVVIDQTDGLKHAVVAGGKQVIGRAVHADHPVYIGTVIRLMDTAVGGQRKDAVGRTAVGTDAAPFQKGIRIGNVQGTRSTDVQIAFNLNLSRAGK